MLLGLQLPGGVPTEETLLLLNGEESFYTKDKYTNFASPKEKMASLIQGD